jgi:hypothetical protein
MGNCTSRAGKRGYKNKYGINNKMLRRTKTAAFAALAVVSACAPAPDQVEASYVSPSIYEGRSCRALMTERNAIVSRVNALTQSQQEASTNDAVATGVALFLFWPAAFVISATKDNATSLAAAKGNYDAITTQMRAQNCELPPEPIAAQAAPTEKKKSWE